MQPEYLTARLTLMPTYEPSALQQHGQRESSALPLTSARWPPAFRIACSRPSRSPPLGDQKHGTRPLSTYCGHAATCYGLSTPALALDACIMAVPNSLGWWSSSPQQIQQRHLPQPSFSPLASKLSSARPSLLQDTPTRMMCTRKAAGHSARAATLGPYQLGAAERRNQHSRSEPS
jgi:hypothetical protein